MVKQMCEVLTHRGPDDEGMVFIKGNQYVETKNSLKFPPNENGFEVAMGHRRLSIIDLSSAAHQPMCNEDGSIWIVFNGEIYNFQELRVELERKGHLFKSRSDTEVILHGYEEWGVDCLHRFRNVCLCTLGFQAKAALYGTRPIGEKTFGLLSSKGPFYLCLGNQSPASRFHY